LVGSNWSDEERAMEGHEEAGGVEVRVVWYGQGRYIAKVRRCEECGEYRGEMFRSETGETRPITCICQGSACVRCKTGRIHKRGTEIMDAKGKVWHVPGTAAFCRECSRAHEPAWLKEERAREAALAGTPEGERLAAEKEEKVREITRWIDQVFGKKEVREGPYGEG
jgi:hypothetical protein